MTRIAAIVNFCSNDVRFFNRCVGELASFSEQIIVPVCDHFFDGTPENRDLLSDVYATHPECAFIEYAYSPEKLYTPYLTISPTDPMWKMYWYGTSRYIGSLYLAPQIEYVLFLDVDEIVDGVRFKEWIKTNELQKYDALRFLSYFYFREARFQAETFQPNALMVKVKALNRVAFFNDWDRYGVFSRVQGPKAYQVLGLDRKPLVHHYSWVKTKEEWKKKSETSAHDWELDWRNQIEKEFSQEFQGTDFIYSLKYRTVSPFFDPLKEPTLQKTVERPMDHVTYVNHQSAFLKELETLNQFQ